MPIKDGFSTSEFWMGLAVVIFTYLNHALGWNLPQDQVMGIAAIVVTYTLSRTIVKAKTISKQTETQPSTKGV